MTIRFLALILAGLHGSGHAQSRFEFTHPLMGTSFRIVVYATDSLAAAEASEAAFDRVADLDNIFSDYLATSEINRLSASAGTDAWTAISDDLWSVLSDAVLISEASGGAFDVTVGVLTREWRLSRSRGRLPGEAEIRNGLARTGYRKVELDSVRRSARLSVRGMRLDFGGIAKGYAADAVLRVLRKNDISVALVDAGGDLVLGCGPPGGEGWNIAVPGGDEETGRMSVISGLESIAIASSGATYQFIEADGVRYSHILDPRSGMGVTAERTVSVAAPTGELADALASMVSVLGADGIEAAFGLGAAWIRIRERSGDGYIVDDHGIIPEPDRSACPASNPRRD